ncbi:MAG: hypothetical protein RL348_1252 [Bacteroidota bacterium]|jgi:hypothetical protein
MNLEVILVGFVALLSLSNSLLIYGLAKHIENLYKRIG